MSLFPVAVLFALADGYSDEAVADLLSGVEACMAVGAGIGVLVGLVTLHRHLVRSATKGG